MEWLSTLITALIVGLLAPTVILWMGNRNRRDEKAEDARIRKQEKIQDYERQDAVAAKVAEAARLLLADNVKVNGKLDVIHTLVNSQMTAAMQSELDAVTRELAMMREVVTLKRSAGHGPSAEALAAIKATETKLVELQTALADRSKQA